MTDGMTMKTVSTLGYATSAIVAASTGMVLARTESPQQRNINNFSSPASPLHQRFSVSPSSSRENSPYPGNAYGDEDNTTGWINNSPQKRMSVHFSREQTPFSAKSATTPASSSSSKKPHKLKRRRSSKVSPPLFGWMRSKSPTPVDPGPSTPSPAVTSSPVMHHDEEHYHLYDVGTRETRPAISNPRYSIASIQSITASTPRTPLKRIYPPPQKRDSPRLISPHNLCQTASCNTSHHGTPSSRETPLIKTLRRRTSDGQMSPTRSGGHRRNQSVPSFDNVASPSPTPDHARTNGYTYETPSRRTVWLVDETPNRDEKSFGSQARRRLEFQQHGRKTSASSSYAQRLPSQSPPSPIPERRTSLNWDSDSDPTYESMKTDHDDSRRKSRLSSLFDDTDIEKASIPDHKSPRTIVRILSRENSQDDLDWGDESPISNGRHPNIKPRLPVSKDVRDVLVPARSTSLTRSKSVPPVRPDPSPERIPKRLSGTPLLNYGSNCAAPKECWDNDFEDEGSDMWMIPENITDAQDKLKGYLSNIRTFSTLIENLKQFRQSHPRSHRRSASQEQILDEIDAMIEISTLDGFTPPSHPGPPPSPKKSVDSFSSSQWSFEEKFTRYTLEDSRESSLPTPPPTGPIADTREFAARNLLEKILGESEEARVEVKPEQITKLIDYVLGLRSRCDATGFDKGCELENGACIGLGVFV